MRRPLLILCCLAPLVVLPTRDAGARLDPLRVITEQLVQAEVIIVLDTSGSMMSPVTASGGGTDCGGDMTGYSDFCGDGICDGSEGTSYNRCLADCGLTGNPQVPAGNPMVCSSYGVHASRMYITKRVLRSIIPDLRRSMSFGLVTFNQTGYFRYYRGISGITEKVSWFVTPTEMEAMGAWDSTNKRPKTTFTWHGTTYTLLSSAGMTYGVDSLYQRMDNLAETKRINFATAGQIYSDGIYAWKYAGSYYTYTQVPIDTNTANSSVETTYKGPQFVDGAGNVWVHNKIAYSGSNYISASSGSRVVVPLASPSNTTNTDAALAQVMGRLNMAKWGGLYASGGTPTSTAISTAWDLFKARLLGISPYTSADPLAACRPRYALVLTDGYHSGTHPASTIASMYADPLFAGSPIKTVVVGLPGLPSSAMTSLDAMADAGDDGNRYNHSATAKFANNESDLARVVKEALFEMVKGDYPTTSSGTTTSGTSTTTGDVALIPSTEYPGWKGHLRAMDLTLTPPAQLWDAGKQLNSMEYKNRRLFTGYPNSNSGTPVPLLALDGTVNWDGSCCGGVGIQHVWSDVEPSLDMTDINVKNTIVSTIYWIVGKDRPWRLGPLLRSTPATIGPPPFYRSVSNHGVFEKLHAARETLIYITSNDGILHAFRSNDGTEAFGYVPPNLWPKIRQLYRNGGHPIDPNQFQWILASSPRVEDMPPITPPKSWKTQLVQGMGPSEPGWVALDISNPSVCTVMSCQINDPPFYILEHSRDYSMSSVMGEQWSVPALFFGYPGTATVHPVGRMGMGSGYSPSAGTEGDYYNYLGLLWDKTTLASKQHPSTGAKVDFAVLADTTASVDYNNRRAIIATYQADPTGRIYRYDKGATTSRVAVLDAGLDNPFYYSPAAFHKGGSEVLLTAVSGSQDEPSPPTSEEATIFVRSETNGSVDAINARLDCPVSDICSQSSGCPATVPTSCSAPTSNAKPTSPPLLLQNKLTSTSNQYEAFYLFYDPPSTVCQQGSTWLIRMTIDGPSQSLISATQYVGVRGTGLTVVGGGLDVVITQVGRGTTAASATPVTNNIAKGALVGDAPYVEVWREVK